LFNNVVPFHPIAGAPECAFECAERTKALQRIGDRGSSGAKSDPNPGYLRDNKSSDSSDQRFHQSLLGDRPSIRI
jgi:hypothetical protein